MIADKTVTDVLPDPINHLLHHTRTSPTSLCTTMSSKAALKAIRTALDGKDYEDAADKSKALVQQDPSNYHG